MQPEFTPNPEPRITSVRPLTLPLIPRREDAVEFAWTPSIARERGIYGFNSADSRSRSFNLVRARITALRRECNWRMLGFVSATPNVGKSFISANVSAALSRNPQGQTYLVDLDLRRGAIGAIFGLSPGSGLEAYLDSTECAGPPTSYVPAGQELIIVPTVPGQVNSAEMLASGRASELLRAMRDSHSDNLFLFDLPPVFANDDTSTVMDMLDSYVLIVEDGKTSQRDVESAVDLLGEDRLAGVILNKYRGGLISEGRGIEDYYAAGYYTATGLSQDEAQNQVDS